MGKFSSRNVNSGEGMISVFVPSVISALCAKRAFWDHLWCNGDNFLKLQRFRASNTFDQRRIWEKKLQGRNHYQFRKATSWTHSTPQKCPFGHSAPKLLGVSDLAPQSDVQGNAPSCVSQHLTMVGNAYSHSAVNRNIDGDHGPNVVFTTAKCILRAFLNLHLSIHSLKTLYLDVSFIRCLAEAG